MPTKTGRTSRASVRAHSPDHVRAKLIDDTVAQAQAMLEAEALEKPPTARSRPSKKVVKRAPKSAPKKQGAIVRTKAKNNKYDWDAIRAIYVDGDEDDEGNHYWPTLKDIGEKYGIPEARMREHSANERWVEQRAVAQSKLEIATQTKRNKELVHQRIEFGGKVQRAADLGAGLILSRFMRIAKDNQDFEARRQSLQQIIDNGGSVRPQDLRGPIYFEEMRALAQALQTLHMVGRTALGETDGGGMTPPDVPTVNNTLNVFTEMTRDDPARQAALLQAAAQGGMFAQLGITGAEEFFFDPDSVVDAEVEEDGEEGSEPDGRTPQGEGNEEEATT